MPPASAAHIYPNPDRGMGISFLLGYDYERKKKKLQEELQLDYKQYAAKKKDLKTNEPRPQPQGFSLPIDDKTSAQEKLRADRKKEYNIFLQEKTQIGRLKRGAPPIISKPGQIQPSDAVYISSPASPRPILNTHTNTHHPPRERPASRRDAATLTETVDNGKNIGTWGPGHRRRRRWQLHRPEEPYSSEEEPITDKDNEFEFRHRRRQDRHTPEPEYKVERRTRERGAVNRAPRDIKEVEAPGLHHQNNNEVWKSDRQMPDSMMTAARSRPATSKDKAEFATGLMIGATEEQSTAQMRKEKYKQELLKQIAEQKINKIREKKLELRVAATGVRDLWKQFGTVHQQYNNWRQDVPYKPGIDLGKDPNTRQINDKRTEDTERDPPGQSHVDYSQLTGKTMPWSGVRAAQGVPPLDYFNEDYHRDFSNILGEVANPRVAGVPPPVLHNVTNNYKTPYDAAYYYYGTRNLLDPNLPYNQNDLPGGVQQSGNFQSPPQRPPPLRPSGRTLATDQGSPLYVGEQNADRSKLKREMALSYQEALRLQAAVSLLIPEIKEREECKRREKEEKERYDAKIEAEMMAYNPWGKSGGGAPIKDQKGNLVSDLNQMHRTNEVSNRNPGSENSGQTQSFPMSNGHSPRVEARTPISHRLSGFNDQPTPQQLHMQNRYKEELKQQIEEKKKKLTEEAEQMRIEEEKEEKKLADQRARIQREFEEEQNKRKKFEHRMQNQESIRKPKTEHQEEEKRVRQKEEIEKKLPESARDTEQKKAQLSYERVPSPPIPTLQRKQTNLEAYRPLSVVSQVSASTEHSASAPQSRPVPAKIPQLQDGKQEVLRELSALRSYLRNEQRQLEVQLNQSDRQESHYTPPNRPKRRPRVDESTHKQAVQPSTRSTYSGAARVNMQNIREFNQLKYRDTASREEVHHMYPDPPTDEHSLDIQQQALLREQQRNIRLMKRAEEHDVLGQKPSHYHSGKKPGRYIPRDSILPSETTFIDVYSGKACEEGIHQQRRRQPSAERQERTAPRKRHDYDEVSMDQRDRNIQPDAQSLASPTSLNLDSKVRAHNQHRITREDTGDRNSRSETFSPEGLLDDDVDVLSLGSALERRVSTETVATEAWLRPGTSDTVKRSGCRKTPNRRLDAPPWLTQHVQ
ncbi:centrosome and spindle pole-associated protein 1 isoform X2 [Etheostoma spectabile]|uniref:centrosome and spindle pole-associated protein 1 isoform X2 n=1 Tax=Etheostoma spectabile TaxID=54343 RepID=UPI0013AF0DFD|nr:centrosome and spindle pole-associated protein 1 isoform X2 [Etheostoma spectabile]